MDDIMAFLLIIIVVVLVLVYRYSKSKSGGYNQDIPLNPGTHRIGEDFPPGKGDLVATAGKGEVCVKRWGSEHHVLKFKLHAEGITDPTGYRNLTLRPHDTLEVNGNLKIMVTPAKAFTGESAIELTQGTYQFGTDLPAAKYNLKAVKNGGSVRYYEPGADDAAYSQDMGGDGKASVYENLLCSPGGRMTIEGKLKLQLTPSKKQQGRMQKVLDFLNQTP